MSLRSVACLCGLWALGLAGCGDDDDLRLVSPMPAPIVFSTEGNRLNAYDPTDGFRKQTVVPSHADDPAAGRDINGQICFAPDDSGRFVAGEDTGQHANPQGFGVFQLHGRRVGDLSATQVGKLVPTYQDSLEIADNYGCAFLPDGRLLTTDIGRSASGPATGQLVVWFPPLDVPTPRYCKIDIEIGTAGGIWIDRTQRVYVASARVTPGIYRYTGPFPTANDAAGGCGRTDGTGAPLADTLRKETFIAADDRIRTPNAVVQTPGGTFYVSSVLNGVIAEYDATGHFLRSVLRPPSGTKPPYPTGTPMGLGLTADGTLYYADLGLVVNLADIGPGRELGTVRRIRFESGTPQPPDLLDQRLNFPDGIGIYAPAR